MITVFTPTYNRAYTLQNLYDSLCRQSYKDFEWIIVDDESTDNTVEMVNRWIVDTNSFNIRLFKQKRGGKHRAINFGIKEAKGEWFFIVDSDDYITDNALEYIYNWTFKGVPSNIAAVSGTKVFHNGSIIGEYLDDSTQTFIEASNTERKKYGLLGDKAEVYKTDVLKKYPFPAVDGELFLTEAVVWNNIAFDGYKIRWYKDPLVVCEYLEDGLSTNLRKNRWNSPISTQITFQSMAKFEKTFINKIKASAEYYAWMHIRKLRPICYFKVNRFIKIFSCILIPRYLIMFYKWNL